MSRRLMPVLVGGLLATIFSLDANALPLAPPAAGVTNPGLTLAAGGCGPGWHRGPYGGCVRNGYYGPYYPARACPSGYHLSSWGRCIPW